MGGDPYRAVEAEAPGAPPREHVLGIRLGEQATTNVEPKDTTLQGGCEGLRTLGVQVSGCSKSQGSFVAFSLPYEEPIGNGEMKVWVRIQGRAEPVQEGDGAQPGLAEKRTTYGAPELTTNCPEQDAQHRPRQLRVPHQLRPQTLGYREYPLSHRHRGHDTVAQVRGHLGHAPVGAGWADAAPLAAEGHEPFLTAVAAARPSEPEREDSAGEVAAEFMLGPRREVVQLVRLGHREIRLKVMLNDLVEGSLLRPPSPIDGR